jgi:signal peptidase I
MIPTLAIGDHIFVNKMSYGAWNPLNYTKYRIGQGPQRGDVIVFVYPVDPKKDFIKRVVGLPGDRIDVRHGQLFINDKPVTRSKKGIHRYLEPEEDGQWITREGRVHEEKTTDRPYTILLDEREGGNFQNWSSKDNGPLSRRPWGPVVKEDHVFVMGDNRDHSSDSRDWGLVPIKNIKGKAFLVWLSWGGGEGFRWERIFHPIR